MAAPRPDDDRVLILRLTITPDGGLRVWILSVSADDGERTLGTVTSSAAAAAIVRGWIDDATELIRPRETPPGR